MGANAPCAAGGGDDVNDYLWLGSPETLGECKADALKQAKAPEEGVGPCLSIVYFMEEENSDFKGLCFCGTTKDWVSSPRPTAISARYDSAQECWGWPFVAALTVLGLGYVIGGAVYNMKTHQRKGFASLPHQEFWLGLRGLVLDGARFTRSGGKFRSAQPQRLGGGGGSGDAAIVAPARGSTDGLAATGVEGGHAKDSTKERSKSNKKSGKKDKQKDKQKGEKGDKKRRSKSKHKAEVAAIQDTSEPKRKAATPAYRGE